MTGGRPHKLTYPKLRLIDAWWAQGGRMKRPGRKVMAARFGVCIRTLENAAKRKYAYSGVPALAPLR